MTRRRDTRFLSAEPDSAVVAAAVVVAVALVVGTVVAGTVVGIVAGTVVGIVALATRSVRGRRTRSSDHPGGVGGLRVGRGGTRRGLLRACTSVDRLVDYLLDRAVGTLPAAARARFAEEWQDHRQHYSGWRLVWWALCVRATALRTTTALEPARLSREG